MQRTTLIKTAVFMLFIGAFACVFVFVQSLAPSEKAAANRPSIRLPLLQPEQFALIDNPHANTQWPSKYLVLRLADNSIRIFELPLKNGQTTLPDKQWWRPGPPCNRFEPNFKTQQFACNDETTPSWFRNEQRWTLQGKSLNPTIFDDMLLITGVEKAGEFVIDPTEKE